jgi:hypothetical protein
MCRKSEITLALIPSLKYEDCISDNELKKRIEAWVSEGKLQQATTVVDPSTSSD